MAKTPYPKESGNAQNTAQGSGLGAKGVIKWRIECGIDGTPVVAADGSIFVISQDGYLHSINPVNGDIKWSTSIQKYPISKRIVQKIPGHQDDSALSYSPLIGSNGILYVGSLDKHVYAIKQKTGSIEWVTPVEAEVQSSATIGPGGLVIIPLNNGKILALDGASGSKKWEFALDNEGPQETPAIGTNGLIYVCGFRDNSCYAFALNSAGKIQWKSSLKGDYSKAITIGSDNTVFVVCGNILNALNGKTGITKWTLSSADAIGSMALSHTGIIYICEGLDKLSAIDSRTGKRKWTVGDAMDSAFGHSLAVDKSGVVYSPCFVKGSPGLQSADGATGRRKWAVSMDGPPSSPAIGADGTIYVSSGGYLYAIQ